MPLRGVHKVLASMNKLQNLIYPFQDGLPVVGYKLLNYHGSASRRDDHQAHESVSSHPLDVPKGCLAVYVGRERRRFVVPIYYLKHHLFKYLLERSANEFGFEYRTGIILPCEVELFRRLLWLIEHNHPAAQKIDLDQLLKNYTFDHTDDVLQMHV
ncbi:hypothetical protein O6H91_06G079300 [Diphasiastrum complanatum]|uniref:Uncharacterized protein n=1 Tax=Diphasiastrum complanatum TaxID=34168 RepID=A0ACC2DG72_DIPCM|nr:hypothetical protein O6H91_Y341900 [Diphasiastrum complanatum]KAJ7552977.1 hypothetical protein O6H91_06G079300 [Diphasiastrum complanatum]